MEFAGGVVFCGDNVSVGDGKVPVTKGVFSGVPVQPSKAALESTIVEESHLFILLLIGMVMTEEDGILTYLLG